MGLFFACFPKKNSDLYQKLRSQLTGGLSMVFCRLAIAGQTKIRPHQVENPFTCAIVKGYDCNALYLHAIMQKNPTGYFCRYGKKTTLDPYLPADMGYPATNGFPGKNIAETSTSNISSTAVNVA